MIAFDNIITIKMPFIFRALLSGLQYNNFNGNGPLPFFHHRIYFIMLQMYLSILGLKEPAYSCLSQIGSCLLQVRAIPVQRTDEGELDEEAEWIFQQAFCKAPITKQVSQRTHTYIRCACFES